MSLADRARELADWLDTPKEVAYLLHELAAKSDADDRRIAELTEALQLVLRYEPSAGDGLWEATRVFHNIARAALAAEVSR